MEWQITHIEGRQEKVTPRTVVGTVTEETREKLVVRLDDTTNDAFWMEFVLERSRHVTDQRNDNETLLPDREDN